MSARGGVIQFRVSVEERAKIDVNAREAGLPLSVFVRARALQELSGSAKDGLTDDGRSPVAEGLARPAAPGASEDKRAVIEELRGQVAGVTGEGMDLVPEAVSEPTVGRWPPPEPVD